MCPRPPSKTSPSRAAASRPSVTARSRRSAKPPSRLGTATRAASRPAAARAAGACACCCFRCDAAAAARVLPAVTRAEAVGCAYRLGAASADFRSGTALAPILMVRARAPLCQVQPNLMLACSTSWVELDLKPSRTPPHMAAQPAISHGVYPTGPVRTSPAGHPYNALDQLAYDLTHPGVLKSHACSCGNAGPPDGAVHHPGALCRAFYNLKPGAKGEWTLLPRVNGGAGTVLQAEHTHSSTRPSYTRVLSHVYNRRRARLSQAGSSRRSAWAAATSRRRARASGAPSKRHAGVTQRDAVRARDAARRTSTAPESA